MEDNVWLDPLIPINLNPAIFKGKTKDSLQMLERMTKERTECKLTWIGHSQDNTKTNTEL